tara:strand:+ start:632 stop:877 length:246 start_codon:yes stop_codon:yes gene_type:complete
MKKLDKPIYFESGFENFKIDTRESERVEDLVGSINEVLKKQNMLLCYCTDEIKNKTLFSAWEIRPYPELKLAQIHKLTNKK